MTDDCRQFHKNIHKLRVQSTNSNKEKDNIDTVNQISEQLEANQEIPHPYLCKQSPFYQQCTNDMFLV